MGLATGRAGGSGAREAWKLASNTSTPTANCPHTAASGTGETIRGRPDSASMEANTAPAGSGLTSSSSAASPWSVRRVLPARRPRTRRNPVVSPASTVGGRRISTAEGSATLADRVWSPAAGCASRNGSTIERPSQRVARGVKNPTARPGGTAATTGEATTGAGLGGCAGRDRAADRQTSVQNPAVTPGRRVGWGRARRDIRTARPESTGSLPAIRLRGNADSRGRRGRKSVFLPRVINPGSVEKLRGFS